MEKSGVAFAVGRLCTGEVRHDIAGEEYPQHAADAIDRQRNAGGRGGVLQTGGELGAGRFKLLVDAVFPQKFQRGEAGVHGQRIARKRSGLVNRAFGRHVVHDFPRGTIGADRQSAADDLAQARDVWFNAVALLRAAWRHAKTRHDFVEDQKRAVFVA